MCFYQHPALPEGITESTSSFFFKMSKSKELLGHIYIHLNGITSSRSVGIYCWWKASRFYIFFGILPTVTNCPFFRDSFFQVMNSCQNFQAQVTKTRYPEKRFLNCSHIVPIPDNKWDKLRSVAHVKQFWKEFY